MLVAMSFVAFGSLVALILGYAVCFALWWFVFRGGADDE
jgi:hypothetical protein